MLLTLQQWDPKEDPIAEVMARSKRQSASHLWPQCDSLYTTGPFNLQVGSRHPLPPMHNIGLLPHGKWTTSHAGVVWEGDMLHATQLTRELVTFLISSTVSHSFWFLIIPVNCVACCQSVLIVVNTCLGMHFFHKQVILRQTRCELSNTKTLKAAQLALKWSKKKTTSQHNVKQSQQERERDSANKKPADGGPTPGCAPAKVNKVAREGQ